MSFASSTLHDRRSGPRLAQSPVEGDRLRGLVDGSRRALARYLTRIGVVEAELDDAMQESFLVVASRLPELPPGSERAFLFATAFRVACNARRGLSRRTRAKDELVNAPSEPTPGVDDLLDRMQARSMLEDALDQLPNDARSVFLLSELHEMPLARIAERLRLPGGTVASRLRRARQSFEEWAARISASSSFDEVRPRAAARATEPGAAGRPEILSWWVSRGEADALRALLRVYDRTHPNAGAVSAAVSGTMVAREQLRHRMTRGVPPDTFQVNGGTELLGWVRRGPGRDRLEPIDCLFTSEGWQRAFPRDVLDLVTQDGRLYAVPVDIHRTNTLFFNRSLLARHGLPAPATLDELHEVAGVLQGRGVVPLAFGYRDPWTLTMLAFEHVLVAVAGGVYYREFFGGRRRPEDPEIRVALAHTARILDYANDDAARLGWDGAVELLRAGRAAMTMMGDWAKGYLANSAAGGAAAYRVADFGQAPSPGARGAFVFATDTFGLPKRASHRAGAIDLLRLIGSREGQDTFNPVKGSIPARIDADLSRYDPVSRATAQEFFWTSTRCPSLAAMVPIAFTRSLEAAMARFARDRDPEPVVAVLRAHYDLLAR